MKKFICVFLFVVFIMGISGCKDNVSSKVVENVIYDEEILRVCDNNEGEYYYLFSSNGIIVDMDIIEYYETPEYIETTLPSGEMAYVWTSVDMRKDLRIVRNYQGESVRNEDRDIRYSSFYSSLLGRALPFSVYSVEPQNNKYYGKNVGEVVFNLQTSNDIIFVEVINHDWE